MKIVKAKLKDRYIGLRVSEMDFSSLQKIAEKKSLSISEMIREIIKNSLTNKTK